MTDGAGLWRRSDSTCGQDAQDGSHRFDRCQHRGMADRKTDAFCTVQQRTQLRLDGKGKVPISAAEAVGQALSELFGDLPLRRIADLLNGCRGGGIQPERLLHIADLRTANQGIHLRAQGGSQQDTIGAAGQMAADVLTGPQLLQSRRLGQPLWVDRFWYCSAERIADGFFGWDVMQKAEHPQTSFIGWSSESGWQPPD